MSIKKLSLLAVLVVAWGSVCSAVAQSAFKSGNGQTAIRKMTPDDRRKAEADFRLNYPHLLNRIQQPPLSQAFRPAGTRLSVADASSAPRRTLRSAELPTELWGALSWASNWSQAYYDFNVSSFAPEAPLTLNKQGSVDDRMGDRGSAIVNGKYYAMTADFTLAAYGYVYAQLYVYDIDTWNPLALSEDGLQNAYTITDYSLIALETAQAQDGTVYGEFYSADLNSREWGIIDYEKQTRTTFGQADREYLALGVTSDNRLYGIALDGNLYQISTVDGTETLVGPTGVKTILNSDSQYYTQSGEIDPKTNTFYWEHINVNTARSSLYTVNLETGAANYVGDFPNSAWLWGLLVPAAQAEADAPARATDLTATFEGPATTGSVGFTAPATTYGGASLTGQLDYQVLLGSDVLATGTVEAGQQAVAQVTAPEGDVQFTVVTRNDAGTSPRAKVSAWVGYDIPQPATDVSLTVNGQDADVTWKAPTAGTHGAYLGDLTYDVYCSVLFSDTVLVASGLTATSCKTRIPDGSLKSYTYIVYVNNGNRQSVGANSNSVISGSAIVPPYTEYFDRADDFYKYTVRNYGDSDATWTWNDQLRCVWSYSVYGTDNDAWLITPYVYLEGGSMYTLTFHSRNGLPNNLNTFEVLWGQGDNERRYEPLTGSLCPPFTWTEYSTEFTPAETGTYKFAFHDNTKGHNYRILLDSISITPNGLPTAPDSATALRVEAGERGALTATVTFTLPTQAMDGSQLTAIDSVQLWRNDTLLTRLDGVQPGETNTYTDQTIKAAGYYRYSVVAFNTGGQGRRAKAENVYVGLDIPEDPQHVRLSDLLTGIGVTWDAISSKGMHGGFVDPATTTVELNKIAYDTWGRTIAGDLMGTTTGGTELVVPMATDEGLQDLHQYLIRSYNDAGSQGYIYTEGIVTGAPYTLPYKESFAHGGANSFVWIEKGVIGPSTQLSADDDGGCVYWTSMNPGDDACLSLGKLSLDAAVAPMLTFAYYAHKAGDPMLLKVQATKADGTLIDLADFDLSKAEASGWTTATVDLSALRSERYVVLKFRPVCTVKVSGDQGQVGIDNVNIRDAKTDDLDVEIAEYTRQAVKGQPLNVVAKVTNYGTSNAKGYTVNVYADGLLAATASGDATVAPLASQSHSFTLSTSSLHEGDQLTVRVELVYAADQDASNNVAEASVKLDDTILPAPAAIALSDDSPAGISVTWTEPVPIAIDVTEDFENYQPWATAYGGWTLVDADKGYSCPFFSDNSYSTPLDYTQYALAVFNPEAIFEGCTEANPFLAAHSGQQYACSVYQIDSQSKFINADNWLISPLLSGEEQTIRFYAHNVVTSDGAYVEQCEVMVSDSDTRTASFRRVGSVVTLADGEWTEVTATLPAGTKYFAIHHVTDADNTFMFSVDDIDYRTMSGTPVAYNVYRDRQLLATVKAADGLHYTDAARADGEHTYAVTAVYADGSESQPVSAAIVTSDIRQLVSADRPVDVYTLDGVLLYRQLTDVKVLKPGVYVVGGQKVIKKQ